MQCFAGFGAGENVISVAVVAKISRSGRQPEASGAVSVSCNKLSKIKGLIEGRWR
jgi:hypothetical protein